ncbi:MAG: FAD-binding oxidoreductase [Myxococcales bacterium]|nr:FAD-binding oxidoreductase [Myxococcales bacterium]
MQNNAIDEALVNELRALLPEGGVLAGEAISEDYGHDETLGLTPQPPAVVLRPASSAEVSKILALAQAHRVPVTPRGSGTGLSGAAVPSPGGILLSTERMKRILEIDTENHVAVVEPGVTLGELDAATAPHGLVYPIQPGESTASLGGNVATNAGGMRAVKYGVTRHQVLGLQAVLPGGEVIECGGKFVKSSSGYDLTQLIVGSEGTLAVVTRIIVKLVPRLAHRSTLLAPFASVEAITRAVPRLVTSGLSPLFVEYMDALSTAGMFRRQQIDLGIPEAISSQAQAYLLVVLEGASDTRLQEDVERMGVLCSECGALDVFLLPSSQGSKVIEAREAGFWAAKDSGSNDQVDVVVPRAGLSEYMAEIQRIAADSGSLIVGTGHAGDGNVHLQVYQGDEAVRSDVMDRIFDVGARMGGVVSAEHGIGLVKKKYFQAREAPAKLALLRRIKLAFDPHGIMNPGKVFDPAASNGPSA